MSDAPAIWATAVYDVTRPGVMVVTEDRDHIGRIVPVQMTTLQPRRIALASTPYAPAEGSAWEETTPGVWVIVVYRREDA